MKETVFVTGAGGFVGSHVASYCESLGCRVLRFGHPAQSGGMPDGIFFDADIGRNVLEAAADGYGAPSVLYHCAGGASVGLSIENPGEDFRRNVQLLSEVLEFARRRSSPIKIVALSSAAVYGDADMQGLKREDMPLAPLSPYGLHKRMAEEMCRFYASYWNMPVAVVRFFSIYGEGLRKQLLWDACRKLKAGHFIFEGAGDEERDWIHVNDAVRLIVLAGENASCCCPVVNGGTGSARSVRSVLTLLGSFHEPKVTPEFSGEKRPGDPRSLVADVQKLRSWGFLPGVDFSKGLKAYWEWFEQEAERC